jgi:predicted phage-related endonuclease
LNEKQWLDERKSGVGGSEAAALLGMNPYMKNTDLYDIKKGIKQSPDINNVEAVIYGKKAEAPLRELFMLDHPEYEVESDPFKVYRNKDKPYILGSFDGILTNKETGERGILEIKTTEVLQSMHKEKME